jgi:hypothetical protein
MLPFAIFSLVNSKLLVCLAVIDFLFIFLHKAMAADIYACRQKLS